jgi:drug/metabolite transporter (DMT)-like permease
LTSALDLTPTRLQSPYGLLIVVGVLLGTVAVTPKLAALGGVPPLLVAVLAPAAAGLLLMLLPGRPSGNEAATPACLRYMGVSGALSVALPYALSFSAAPHVGGGFVAATFALPPILTYLFGLALGTEQAEPRRVAAAVVCLVGALIIVGVRTGVVDEPLWSLLALAAPVSSAAGNIYRSRYWPEGARPRALAPGMLLAAALWLVPVAGFTLTGWDANQATPTGWSALLLQCVVLAAMYPLFFRLQWIGGPVFLSQIGYVSLLFGIPVSAVLFNEPTFWSDAIGAALVLLGLAWLRPRPAT